MIGIDRFDVLTLVGLGLIGAGIGMISIPWALITVGALVVLFGLVGSFYKARAQAAQELAQASKKGSANR